MSYHVMPIGGTIIVGEHDEVIAIAQNWGYAAELVDAYNGRIAARQPSPSAREAALKCAEICERPQDWNEAYVRSRTRHDCAVEIRAYAETLSNESVARVDGYGNGAPDAPSPAATDPAPEAADLEWTLVHNMCESAIGLDYRWSRKNAETLRDMALRSFDLKRALARAQEDRDSARLEAFERARGEEEATQRYERAEAELEKVRDSADLALLQLAMPHKFRQNAAQETLRAALASAPSAKEGQPGEQSEERK